MNAAKVKRSVYMMVAVVVSKVTRDTMQERLKRLTVFRFFYRLLCPSLRRTSVRYIFSTFNVWLTKTSQRNKQTNCSKRTSGYLKGKKSNVVLVSLGCLGTELVKNYTKRYLKQLAL